jgi:hypothetical protein
MVIERHIALSPPPRRAIFTTHLSIYIFTAMLCSHLAISTLAPYDYRYEAAVLGVLPGIAIRRWLITLATEAVSHLFRPTGVPEKDAETWTHGVMPTTVATLCFLGVSSLLVLSISLIKYQQLMGLPVLMAVIVEAYVVALWTSR